VKTNRLARTATTAGFKLLCACGFLAVAVPLSELLVRDPAIATTKAAMPVRVAKVTAAEPAMSGKPADTIAPAKPVDDRFVVKRILPIDGPFRHGDYVWDDKGVPAGPLVVTVDLAAQTLSVFRGGYEIGAAVILYGANEVPTPLGVFPITQKDADHVSNLYDAPMPYMLRLTNDGISIHGSEVDIDSATHGCIGVPKKFAKLLFAQAKIGDKVIVTNGKALDMGESITAS